MSQLGRLGRAAVFCLLPAAASGGAMALPALLAVGGAASLNIKLLVAAAQRAGPATLLFLAWLVWALASTAWSPEPQAAAQAARTLATIAFGAVFVIGAIADGRAKRWTRAGLLAAVLVLMLLLAIEAGFDMPLNRAMAEPDAPDWVIAVNPGRGVTVLITLIWAAAASLLTSRWRLRLPAAAALTIAAALLALQFAQFANAAAFAFGLAAVALGYTAPRFGLWLLCAGWAAWLLCAPFAIHWLLSTWPAPEDVPFGLAHRLGIWEYVSGRILEQPWIGHGLDASRAVTDHILVAGAPAPAVPLHPHSASLQIWYEMGLVGAALMAAALLATGRALSRSFGQDRVLAAMACGVIASLGVTANVSYGLWQEWWTAAIVISVACAGAAARLRGTEARDPT